MISAPMLLFLLFFTISSPHCRGEGGKTAQKPLKKHKIQYY